MQDSSGDMPVHQQRLARAIELLPAASEFVQVVRELLSLPTAGSIAGQVGLPEEVVQTLHAVDSDAHCTPGRTTQRAHSHRTPVEELAASDRVYWHLAVFHEFEKCISKLTAPQWAIICAIYRDGKSKEAIARESHVSASSISTLVTRAWANKEKFERQLRREQAELVREFRRQKEAPDEGKQ